MDRPKRYALAVELTSACNQKCSYCYNDWRDDGGKSIGSLPASTLSALVEKALREVDFDHVTLTGGEPFSRPELFDVLEVCRRHGVRAQLISNGGIITDEQARRLATYKPLFVQVTLNGPTLELHEAHVGEGHWERTLRGIGLLQSAGVPVQGCVVVTRKNAHLLGDTLALWRSLGVRSVALSRFSPAGYAARFAAELLPSRGEMLAALGHAQEAARAHGMGLQVTMPMPPCVVEHSDYPDVHFGGCPIGTEMQEFALGPQGELRNCTLHTEPLGHVGEQSVAELVSAPAVARYRDVSPAFCEPCAHKASCLGGCGAAAASTLGDRSHVDPFVAQHVEPEFRAALASARGAKEGFVPASMLARGKAGYENSAKVPASTR